MNIKVKDRLKLFGGKASNLLEIADSFNVPKFSVLDTNLFNEFVKYNDIYKRIESILYKSDIRENSEKIKQIFLSSEFSKEQRSIIQAALKNLNEPLAIRSSANLEDLPNESFAGAFKSVLYVKKDNVEQAIKEVYASLFNERVLNYIKANNIAIEDIKMAVIMQEMITNGKYGVLFFSDNGILIQVGLDPDAVISANTKDIDTYFIKDSTKFKYPFRHGVSMLFEYEIEELEDIAKRLKSYNFPLDAEFAIKDGNIYILQQRRLTKEIPNYSTHAEVYAFPASEGIAVGKATILRHNASIEELPKGKDRILIAEEIELDYAPKIKDFAGVCIEIPGITSHAVIYARENNIPCIVGATDITKIVKDDELIEINGSTGEIRLIDRPGISIGSKIKSIEINYKDLKPFRYKKDLLLIKELEKEQIIFHVINDKKLLLDIVKTLEKERDKPVSEGSVDIWYAYANIIELESLDKNLAYALDKAYITAKEGSIESIREAINKQVEISERLYNEAFESYKRYAASKNKSDLVNGFLNAILAEAHNKIATRLMLFEFIDDRANKDKEIFNFVAKMEEDSNLNDITNSIRNLIDRFLEIYKSDFGIEYVKYSSQLALIEALHAK
ncbi:MAG: phosphoenolpyruvate synthase [Candidatus Micrarchaeota archaeon]|nr:MAG: phosphoenolpyruvate synthase [Candidatus Micrarchaeota archaeon]